MNEKKITIIGTGAYGTALANVLSDNGHRVLMYGIEEKQVLDINVNHMNQTFFKDVLINEKIRATTDLAVALEDAEIVILSVPTFAVDSVLEGIIKYGKRKMHIINTAKGLDEKTLDVLSKKIFKKLDGHNVLLSVGAIYGPSVAIEVVTRKPTCVMSCNENLEIAEYIANLLTNEYFIVKPTTDVVGSEIAAALKNTVAIACGMLTGFGGADNARASLITIGNSEIYKIAKYFGAKIKTFMNFAALGDLILTSTSLKSRNFSLGLEIAEKDNAEIVLKSHKTTVEGVYATKLAHLICQKHQIFSPFFEIMYKIIYNNGKPSALINEFFKNAEVA